jgi:predicted Rossmann fold nucleotide-binding protein DprA/Smf involved in DNA uptake
MKKKQKSFSIEPLIEFMTDRIKVPSKSEIDKLIKKTEQSLHSLKMPTKAEFDQLTKRVEALEKALKIRKGKTKAKTRTKAGKKAATKKKQVSRAKPKMTGSEKVLRVMKKSRAGVNVATLNARTGIEDKKLRNILYRLAKQGKVKRAGRGVYRAAS